MKLQGHIRIQQHQADLLFGKLGTHSKCAGGTLWLRDIINNDSFGRQVTVLAEGRRVAASAINTALFQLCHEFAKKPRIADSEWYYIKGELQGPHPYFKMVKWARKGWFPRDDMPVQHASLKCWVPLWFLLQMDSMQGGGLAGEAHAVSMDLDELVQDIKHERQSGLLSVLSSLGPGRGPEEFPELLRSALASGGEDASQEAEPMDYEGSPAAFNGSLQGGARVFVVVDTSVLMSNMASIERTFEDLAMAAGALEGQEPNRVLPVVEALLLVPWVVLNELDQLKHSKKRLQADSARYALTRLRQLTSARDTFVRAQTAAEHARAASEVPSPLAGNARELRNDDLILQTCEYYRERMVQRARGVGLHASVVLLSNDSGLCVRAQVSGFRCYTLQALPKDPQVLLKHSLEWEEQHATPTARGRTAESSPSRALQPQPLHTGRNPLEGGTSGAPLSPTFSGGAPPGFSPRRAAAPTAPAAAMEGQPAQVSGGAAAANGLVQLQQPLQVAPVAAAAAAQASAQQAWQQEEREQLAVQVAHHAADQARLAEADDHMRRLQLQHQQPSPYTPRSSTASSAAGPPAQHQPHPQAQMHPQAVPLHLLQQQTLALGQQYAGSGGVAVLAPGGAGAQNPAIAVAAMLAQSVGLTIDQLFQGLGEAQAGREPSPQILAVLQTVQQNPDLFKAMQAAAAQPGSGGPGTGPSPGVGDGGGAAAATTAQQAAQQQQHVAAQQAQRMALLQQLAGMDPQEMVAMGLHPSQVLELQQGLLLELGQVGAAQQAQQDALAAMQRTASGVSAASLSAARSGSFGQHGSVAGSPGLEGGRGSGLGGPPASPSAAAGGGMQLHHRQALVATLAQQQQQAGFADAQAQQAQALGGAPSLAAALQMRGGAGQPSRLGSMGTPGSGGVLRGQGDDNGMGVMGPPGAVAESWDHLATAVCKLVERSLAPFVAYHRQQEFGDFWLDMLGRDHQPPWDARATMEIMAKGDFTGFLSRSTKDEAVKALERFCFHRWRAASRGQGAARPPDPLAVRDAAAALAALAQELSRNVSRPVPNAETPSPDTIGPEFVSLGMAAAALQQGASAAQALLAECSQKLQQGG